MNVCSVQVFDKRAILELLNTWTGELADLKTGHTIKLEIMARQTGLIKLKGTLDNVNFYKSKDGNLARMKTSVDAKRIANDPAFARTRENGKEFGNSAKSGKLVRDTLRPLMMVASDGRVTARMTKVMTAIKSFDATSSRGNRKVVVGIANPAAKALIKGFNFNITSNLGSVLHKPFVVTPATGEIAIQELIPLNDLSFPTGATHFSIRSAWAGLDFGLGVGDLQLSPVQNYPIDGTQLNLSLTPASSPDVVGFNMHLLLIEFFQLVNGVQYSLKNGAYNTLAVVEVQ